MKRLSNALLLGRCKRIVACVFQPIVDGISG
jgi:hypothetical protein